MFFRKAGYSLRPRVVRSSAPYMDITIAVAVGIGSGIYIFKDAIIHGDLNIRKDLQPSPSSSPISIQEE